MSYLTLNYLCNCCSLDNQRAHIVNVTVDKFAAHVSWKPPAQNAVNVTSYILNVSVYDEKLVKVIRNKVNISLNFNSTKHLVTGLKPSTFYTFQIQFLQHSALDSAVVYKRTLVAGQCKIVLFQTFLCVMWFV